MTDCPYKLIDSHVHLQDETFELDRPAVLSRARSAGLRYFINNGTRESDWEAVVYQNALSLFGPLIGEP